MILQTIEELLGSNIWFLGIAISFGLAFIFTILLGGDEFTFFGILTIFFAFMAWGGIIQAWIFYLVFIVYFIFLGYSIYLGRKSND